MKITLKYNDRIAIIGKTGSGKTYLAQHICSTIPRLVVFDTKGNLRTRFNLEKWSRKTYRKLQNGKDVRLQVTSPIMSSRDLPDYYDSIFAQLLSIGNLVIYIDEAYDVTLSANNVTPYLRAIYTKGRELGIGTIASVQRPKNVPNIFFTEAEHIFMFKVQLEDDRKKVAGVAGDKIMLPIYDQHGFYYYNSREGETSYYKSLDKA